MVVHVWMYPTPLMLAGSTLAQLFRSPNNSAVKSIAEYVTRNMIISREAERQTPILKPHPMPQVVTLPHSDGRLQLSVDTKIREN